MKKILFLIACLIFVNVSFAADFISGENVLLENPIQDNLYITGGSVNILSNTGGDIFALGGNVNITSSAKDIALGAGEVKIIGKYEDIRLICGKANIDSNISGDLIVFSGEVKVSNTSIIEKDVRILAGTVVFDGIIKGDAKISGGSVLFNGIAEKNLTIQSDDFKLGPNAIVKGDLKYLSQKNKTIDKRQVYGETIFEKSRKKSFSEKLADKAVFTLVLLVAGLILLWLFKSFSKNIVEKIISKPLPSMITGLISLIVIPIISIILLMTIILIPLGLIIIVFYALAIFLSLVFAGILTGKFIFKEKISEFTSFIIGVIIFEALTLIPGLGGFLNFAAIIFGLGSTTLLLYDYLKTNQKSRKKGGKKSKHT